MLSMALLSGASILFYQNELYFCLLFTFIGAVILIIYEYRLQRHSSHLIHRMVESIRYDDLSLSFSVDQKDTLEQRLRKEINEVIKDFKEKQTLQQERYQYYETLLDTVDCCLLVIDRQQHIQWMNKAAVQELIGHRIHTLEELLPLNKELIQTLVTIQPGEMKLIKLYKENFIQEMAVTVADYYTPKDKLRLINLKNVRSILEENEMEAWQKLIRVLTHEIMNSITPIISLSDTLCDRISENEKKTHNEKMIFQGIKTIHRRSEGLLNFVNNYRKLSQLPAPELTPVRIGELMSDIKKLFPDGIITYHYAIENENQILHIDRSQIEQVLINLLKNAGEACEDKEQPEVHVTSQYHKEKQIFELTVTDNGCGILPDVQNKIFIPFFTTKAKGSGIGLSLCKQIVNNHGGSISVISETNKGTSFILKFLCK